MARSLEIVSQQPDIHLPSELHRVIGNVPDVLVVLGGGRARRSFVGENSEEFQETPAQHLRYRTSPYTGLLTYGENASASGARARVYAAVTLDEFFPEKRIQFITTGHKSDVTGPLKHPHEEYFQGNPDTATVMASELAHIGNIADDRVTILERPTTTYYEIMDVISHTAQLLREPQYINTVSFLTNGYQVPRVQAFIDMFVDPSGAEWFFKQHLDLLQNTSDDYTSQFVEEWVNFCQDLSLVYTRAMLTAVSAEQILPFRDKRWGKVVESLQEWPAWKRSLQNDVQGTRALQERTYQFNLSKCIEYLDAKKDISLPKAA